MTKSLQQNSQNSLNSQVRILTISGVLPFVFFTFCVWFPQLNPFEIDAIVIFRFYSIVILSFMAGALWPLGFIADLSTDKRKVVRTGLLWGSIMIALAGWGTLFLLPKVAIFVSALLFLVVWQIENKTELVKSYPQWYASLRAAVTMAVSICHMSVWMTIA